MNSIFQKPLQCRFAHPWPLTGIKCLLKADEWKSLHYWVRKAHLIVGLFVYLFSVHSRIFPSTHGFRTVSSCHDLSSSILPAKGRFFFFFSVLNAELMLLSRSLLVDQFQMSLPRCTHHTGIPFHPQEQLSTSTTYQLDIWCFLLNGSLVLICFYQASTFFFLEATRKHKSGKKEGWDWLKRNFSSRLVSVYVVLI